MAARKPPAKPKFSSVPGAQKGARKAIHAGRYVHDEAFNEEAHDLGPWIETPKSTRVSSFRYDYLNNAIQVRWTNNGPPYIYLERSYENFRGFARAVSKGRYVNNGLGQPYRQMTPDEENAPSNAERRAITSRVRV